jgi:hypothetical protein
MIPHLLAEPYAGGLRVWCHYCVRFHQHGAGYGHRAAHCRRDDSPYLRTGYVLIASEAA